MAKKHAIVTTAQQTAIIKSCSPKRDRRWSARAMGITVLDDAPKAGPAYWQNPRHSGYWSKRVLQILAEGPGLSQTALARKLRVSVSSLQKQLNNERTSFGVLQDEIRRAVATRLVLTDQLILKTHIIPHLGYQSESSFYRAWASRLVGPIAVRAFRAAIERVVAENGLMRDLLLITGWLISGADSPPIYLGFRYCGNPVDTLEGRYATRCRLAAARSTYGRAAYDLDCPQDVLEKFLHVQLTHQSGLFNPEYAIHPLTDERKRWELDAAIGSGWRVRLQNWWERRDWRAVIDEVEMELECWAPLTDQQRQELSTLSATLGEVPRRDVVSLDYAALIALFVRSDGSPILSSVQQEILKNPASRFSSVGVEWSVETALAAMDRFVVGEFERLLRSLGAPLSFGQRAELRARKWQTSEAGWPSRKSLLGKLLALKYAHGSHVLDAHQRYVLQEHLE